MRGEGRVHISIFVHEAMIRGGRMERGEWRRGEGRVTKKLQFFKVFSSVVHEFSVFIIFS